MADLNKGPIGKDAGGTEEIAKAVQDMLNAFPGKPDDVLFEELGTSRGLAFINDSGALVYTEKRSITGKIHQECRYPFILVYRRNSPNERTKMAALQLLDIFGKWICGEPTLYDLSGETAVFPKLTGGRTITRITRDNIYSQEPQKDGTQDWVLPVTVEYTNTFRKAR